MFETSLYKANKGLASIHTLVLSLAAFWQTEKIQSICLKCYTFIHIIRNSGAFSAVDISRPLNENHLRMDHVWEETMEMTAIPEKAEMRSSD